jgi:hypothetical protein
MRADARFTYEISHDAMVGTWMQPVLQYVLNLRDETKSHEAANGLGGESMDTTTFICQVLASNHHMH